MAHKGPAKIQGRAGHSMAACYDLRGSIAGLEEMDLATTVPVLEIDGRVFAERLQGAIRRLEIADIVASEVFNAEISNFPEGHWKLHGIQVITGSGEAASNINNLTVNLVSNDGLNEIPIWVWDDGKAQINRISIAGAAAGNADFLDPHLGYTLPPIIISNAPARGAMDSIFVRGIAQAFGAGEFDINVFFYLSHVHVTGISSFGLPVPSW